jgi:cytochrome b involved in lipid metabolism
MKKTIIIALFLAVIVATAVITAGLMGRDNTSSTSSGNEVLGTMQMVSKEVSLSMDEVSNHAYSYDCWIVIDGVVYNVGSYAKDHPGGDQAIFDYCGEDATAAFEEQGHSDFAHQLLGDFYIGDIGSTVDATNTVPTSSASSSGGGDSDDHDDEEDGDEHEDDEDREDHD